VANIYFYNIDTPLKKFVASHPHLMCHCDAVHVTVLKSQNRSHNLSCKPSHAKIAAKLYPAPSF
jgi:hypothetical protein